MFYLHKFKRSKLRYKIGLIILSGDIYWVSGLYKYGNWQDIKIFHDLLLNHLGEGEKVEVDDGYISAYPECAKYPKGFINLEEREFMRQRYRNRWETGNKRLKQFGILKHRYRHDITKDGIFLRDYVVLNQIVIDDDDYFFAC